MREEDLRRVMLVQAIEDADRDGTLVPAADRMAAARAAKREVGGDDREALAAHRARTLTARIVERYPFIAGVLALAHGTWLAWLLGILGLLAGVGLSALDGSRRINILAFPLAGLVLFNLAVYAWLAARPKGRWLPALAARAAGARLAALIARSRAFHAPLAQALSRFASDWHAVARPVLVARVARALHLAAAAVGIGLVAGLYLRGIAFDFQAGWESTFLEAPGARRVLAVFYGPASWLTGIAIPEPAHLDAIRWRGATGGEGAARWIHLLAATALLFVIVPRLVLALVATLGIRRLAARLPWPAALDAHFRAAFAGVGVTVDRGIAVVVPCGYEPAPEALAALREWIPANLGEQLTVDVREPVRYGAEDAFVRSVGTHGGEIADLLVLLASAAATPEDENHGVLVAAARDWMAKSRPHARLAVVVDEAPYAARTDAARLEERREAWKAFVAAHGLEARFARLAP